MESSHRTHRPARAVSARAARGRRFDPEREATAPGCRACSSSREHRVGSLAGQDQSQGVSKQNRKSKNENRNEFVFESVLDVVSKHNQNVKREMQPKNMGKLQPTGRSNYNNTCRQSSVRQHKSTKAAGMHEKIATPGGRWASHGGGSASDVDAPG